MTKSKILWSIFFSQSGQKAGSKFNTKNGAQSMTKVKNTTPKTLVAFCSSLIMRPCLQLLRDTTLLVREWWPPRGALGLGLNPLCALNVAARRNPDDLVMPWTKVVSVIIRITINIFRVIVGSYDSTGMRSTSAPSNHGTCRGWNFNDIFTGQGWFDGIARYYNNLARCR